MSQTPLPISKLCGCTPGGKLPPCRAASSPCSSNHSEVTMHYIMVLICVDLLIHSCLEYSRAQHNTNRLSFSRPRQSLLLLVVHVVPTRSVVCDFGRPCSAAQVAALLIMSVADPFLRPYCFHSSSVCLFEQSLPSNTQRPGWVYSRQTSKRLSGTLSFSVIAV